MRSPLPVRWVSAALALQLTAAAAALLVSPSWQVPPRTAAAPVVAPATAVVAQSEVSYEPPVLSAPTLWPEPVRLSGLGLDDRGALQVPATAGELGWWQAGPRPGEPGAAVVVGHVDLDGRPGVFARLADAAPGTVLVLGTGPEAMRFRVASVDRYAKTQFPTDVVYRPTAEPELRLITCGGRFDPRTGHYEDNVVVRAVRA